MQDAVLASACLPGGTTWVPAAMRAPITLPQCGHGTDAQPPDPTNTIISNTQRSLHALRHRGAAPRHSMNLQRRDVPHRLRRPAIDLNPAIHGGTAAFEKTVGYSMQV